MSKKQKTIEKYYDKQSLHYDVDRFSWNPLYYKLLNEANIEAIAPYAKDKKVLEVGCGTGVILEKINSFSKEATGMDLSPKMVETTKSKGLNAVLGSAERIPFENNSFDVVYSVKVLSHVLDIKKGLKEIARITKKDGHMLLEFYNKYSLKNIAYKIAGEDVYTRFDSLKDVQRYLPADTEIVGYHGSRIITLHAGVFKIPFVGKMFYHLEKILAKTFLKKFASYQLVVVGFKEKNE